MTQRIVPRLSRRNLLLLGISMQGGLLHGVNGFAAERPEIRAGARQLVTIAVPALQSPSHLPVFLAHELGFLRQEGVLLEWLSVDSEAAATQAISRGRADVASCDFSHALHSQIRGLDLQAIAVQMRAPQVVFGLLPRLSNHFKGLPDLKGRKVGVLSTVTERLVVAKLLQPAGLQESDLSWAHFADSSDMLEQLRGGWVDGFCMDHALVSALELRGEARLLADTRSFKGAQDLFGGPVPGAVLAAPVTYVRQHPDVCQALVNGVVRALKWLRTAGPSDLFRLLPETMPGGDRAQFLAAFEKARDGLAVDALMDPVAASTAALALSQVDDRLRGVPLRAAYSYSNDFALRAKQRFRV